MPNIKVGPNFIVATENAAISSRSVITDNSTAEILGISDDGVFLVYTPAGGSFNSLEEFEASKGYQVTGKTAFDLPGVIPAAVAASEAIVWGQLENATNSAGGDLNCTAASGECGGTATKKLTKANGNYIEMTMPDPIGNGNGAVLILTSLNDANYDWSSPPDRLASVYWNNDDIKVIGNAGGSPVALGTTPAGTVVRMEISGDDVLVKKSTDNTTFTTIHTFSGVLSGIAAPFIKGVFAVPTANSIINNAKGAGLVTI